MNNDRKLESKMLVVTKHHRFGFRFCKMCTSATVAHSWKDEHALVL